MKADPYAVISKDDLELATVATQQYKRGHLLSRLFGPLSRYGRLANYFAESNEIMRQGGHHAVLSEYACTMLYIVLKYCGNTETDTAQRERLLQLRYKIYSPNMTEL